MGGHKRIFLFLAILEHTVRYHSAGYAAPHLTHSRVESYELAANVKYKSPFMRKNDDPSRFSWFVTHSDILLVYIESSTCLWLWLERCKVNPSRPSHVCASTSNSLKYLTRLLAWVLIVFTVGDFALKNTGTSTTTAKTSHPSTVETETEVLSSDATGQSLLLWLLAS